MSTPAPPDPRLRTDPDGEQYAVGRLPGHSLRARGQAYLTTDCYEGRCATNVRGTVRQENGVADDSVRGVGHALCQCGALSGHLEAGAHRRDWQRQHRARVILGQPEPAGQPRPVAAKQVA